MGSKLASRLGAVLLAAASSPLEAIIAGGRSVQALPVAVVDIGSNSVRLVVYEGQVRSPNILYNEKLQAGLGAGVAETGAISSAGWDRTLASLVRFRHLIAQCQASAVHAFATAAVRDASNGPAFLEAAQDKLGAPIEVFSGKQEAHYAALGVASGFYQPRGLVGDMGGGSLEILRVKKGEFSHGKTLPLGGLRLDHDAGGNPAKAAQLARGALADAKAVVKADGEDFFAVGGTWRNIAKLHMAETDYSLRMIHDYQMSRDDAVDFCQRLMAGEQDVMKAIGTVSSVRQHLLPFGAAVLSECLLAMNARRVRFSAVGVREGFLHDALPPAVAALDPLLSAAHNLASLRARSVDHAVELCGFTQLAFECFGLEETEEQARLRWAGCLLADTSWRAHPDYRGEQSLNIIANGDFLGIDHPGRAFLALVSYYRNEGLRDDELSDRLLGIAGPQLTHRAKLLGGLMRIAYLFTGFMPNILPQLAFDGSAETGIELVLPTSMADMDGERPQRRLRQLGGLIDAETAIRIAD
ncbi:MAG: Ppx/GppA phosphatase family protein [Pseudomonadota bacterium]